MTKKVIVFTTGVDGSIFFINKQGKAIELTEKTKPSLQDNCDLSQLSPKELDTVKKIMQPDIELYHLTQQLSSLGA
jgi:hypothetical protein